MAASTLANALTWALFLLMELQCINPCLSFSPPRAPLDCSSSRFRRSVALASTTLSDTKVRRPPAGQVVESAQSASRRPRMPPRKLKTVNPFRLTRVEAQYLASTALSHSKFSSFNAFAFLAVDKLQKTPSLLRNVQDAALASTRPSRVASLLYSSSRRDVNVVQENVPTVAKDSQSGEISLQKDIMLQAVTERIAYLVLEDLNNIREGIYPIPSELKLTNQAGPEALPSAAKQFLDGFNFAQADTYEGSPDYLERREPSPYLKELSSGLDLPEYYMTDFHSVPGGFLSPQHAEIYDLLSEIVFVGTHFMARRMVLRPIAEAIQKRSIKHEKGRELRLLDLGTGPGTFLIQLREAFPALELEGLDLSPAMLEYATTTCRKHPSFRDTKEPTLTRGSMEAIPRDDATFDFVTETNCFHEMPEYAIQNVAREASRVLKEGGLFLHLDAVQMKDDDSIAATSRVTFDSKFNEPFMMNWMEKVDLDAIFAAEGLQPFGPARPFYQSTLRVYSKVD